MTEADKPYLGLEGPNEVPHSAKTRKSELDDSVAEQFRKPKRSINNISIREELYKKQEGRCYYCNCEISYYNVTLDVTTATIDHKEPLARGGANNKENKCLACPGCNNEKGRLTAEEYFLVLAFRRMQIAKFNGEDHSCVLCKGVEHDSK